MGRKESITPDLTPSRQGESVQSKTSGTPGQPNSPDDLRSSQRAKNPLAPLSPEESKTRDNNIAHIKHLKEAMKKGLKKWDEIIKKEKNPLEQAWMRGDREKLNDWIADINMVLDATRISPVYVPIVREVWIQGSKTEAYPYLRKS